MNPAPQPPSPSSGASRSHSSFSLERLATHTSQVSGKSKYGMPIFLPNGNINPAYLAAERKDQAAVKAVRRFPPHPHRAR